MRRAGSDPGPLFVWEAHGALAAAAVLSLYASMNSRQRRTLEAIFADPVSGSIAWDAIESLLVAVGCEVVEGNGSRVRFVKGSLVAFFHRPHPAKEAKRHHVRLAREYLTKLGVVP